MPAPSTSNTKTVTTDIAPHLSAAYLTVKLGQPAEVWTVADLHKIVDATKRVPGGDDPARTLASLFL
jgi:hypothetical protein